MEKTFIIDAHAFLHRSYHALPKFTTSKGMEVGALFGFSRLILKILREYSPEYLAVCFDSKGHSFRNGIYPEYKANRAKTDPALVDQLSYARDLVRALGLKPVFAEGYEADDLIAAVAKKSYESGCETVIVSGDKDILQLINEKTSAWDGSSPEFRNKAYVTSKFGVAPENMPDYLALLGDASDNVPGAEGIGQKSAAKLIGEYGTAEKIIEAANSGAAGDRLLEKVRKSAETVKLSKRLVKLTGDLPFDLPMEDFRPEEPDSALLSKTALELEFKELLSLSSEKTPAEEIYSAKRLGLEEALKEAGGNLSVLAYGGNLYAGSEKGVAGLTPLSATEKEEELLRKTIGDENIRKIFFGLKQVLDFIKAPAGFKPASYTDAQAACALLLAGSREESPERLMAEKLGARIKDTAAACALLHKYSGVLEEEIRKTGQEEIFRGTELPLLPVVYSMEKYGVAVDREHLKKLSDDISERMGGLEKKAREITGLEINLNSPKQLSAYLYTKTNIPLSESWKKRFRTRDGYSTGEEALNEIKGANPLIDIILEYREIAKLKSSFTDPLYLSSGRDGCVHTTFDQLGTATGRFSSSRPNLQNIPARYELGLEVRKAFVAREGSVLLSADYSQIELRILASLSGDKNLTRAFINGEDIHRRTAAEIFHYPIEMVTPEMRRSAKAINFGIVYGQTAQGLSQELKISRAEAAKYIKHYFEVCPGVKEWSEKAVAAAREKGYTETFAGRRRPVPELNSSVRKTKAFGERIALNAPIQGACADIIKKAMVNIDAGLDKSAARMLLQVHDELIFEVRKEKLADTARAVKREMENAYRFDVPITAELKYGNNWKDMESYNPE